MRFKFIACYINRNKYFGQRVTLRVESSYNEIKSYISNSHGDLKFVVDSIKLLMMNKKKD